MPPFLVHNLCMAGQTGTGVLQVLALHEHDALGAEQGGADQVELVGSFEDDWTSPEPALVEKVCNTVNIEVWPLLRLRPGFRTDGGEVTRMQGLISSYLVAGASGIIMGFLDGYSRVDVEVVTALTEQNFDWIFDRAFDQCLKPESEWTRLFHFENLKQVATAGSSISLEKGLDNVICWANSDSKVAKLIMAAGDLEPEQVPWLVRAGVRAFQVGDQVRPGRSRKAYVDADLVRSWRSLVDSTIGHVEKAK